MTIIMAKINDLLWNELSPVKIIYQTLEFLFESTVKTASQIIVIRTTPRKRKPLRNAVNENIETTQPENVEIIIRKENLLCITAGMNGYPSD